MVVTRTVHYEADGLELTGRLAVPDGAGPCPAVLVAHEGPGLDDFQLARADTLAELGYVAFALDYHGPLAPFADRDVMMRRLDELSAAPERTRALGRAALDVVLAEPRADPGRVAAIGYCYGGTLVLELARDGAPLAAVVGFHPGLATICPEDARNIGGRVLVCIGADDPIVPAAQRATFEAEMRAGGVDWQMHLYCGVQHSFTHPMATAAGLPGIAYDPVADRRSWQAMLDLFAETLGAAGSA